jgi:simple sugar transport system ATP-binding protein
MDIRIMKDIIKMTNISKSFGKVQALQNVNFNVGYVEIVGLVGDNGAGKSTLIKVLTGVFKPNAGEIFIEGRRVDINSHTDSRNLGIETVYQDLALIPLMNISRNLFLGREPVIKVGPFKILDIKAMNRTACEIINKIGVKVRSSEEQVAILSGGERQCVAIARALYFSAKLLIMDEPTSSLSIKESQRVLKDIVKAKDKGVSSIFITHNIHHVFSIADRLVILEGGHMIVNVKKEDTNIEEIEKIIGSGYDVVFSEKSK